MAATGPFNKSYTEYWTGSTGNRKRYDQYTWWRNGPGRKVPHPLTQVRSIASNRDTDCRNARAGYYAGNTSVPAPWATARTDVHNRAYSKYVDQARGTSSQLGATAAEWGQSSDMLERRLQQLYRAMRALRRGRPYQFFEELGMLHKMPRRLPRRSDPKKAGDLWLEWHFGWVPLTGDVYDSVQVLQKPIPTLVKVKARAVSGKLWWDNSYTLADRRVEDLLDGRCKEEIGARVRVSNPNLHLANSLGLVNPVSVLWEVVPFSFVVDWFIPVGQFIESWTDTLGLTIEEPYTTESREYHSKFQEYVKSTGAPNGPLKEGRGWRVVRTTTITGPTLALRPWKAPSLTRAATAISLLLQQFALAGARK